MFWRTLSAAAVAALMLTATATAHSKSSTRSLSDSHVGTTKTELVAQRDYSRRIVTRLAHSWRFAPRHRSCWSHVPWAKLCDATRRKMFAHRWLEQLAAKRLDRLYPSVGHLAGWRCITYGAHPGTPGDPHEGHGVSPDGYRGALQMTHTWSGYTMAWESMSDTAVYAIAEKVAAAHGFSYSWMAGQWPNTFPPCAGLFAATSGSL